MDFWGAYVPLLTGCYTKLLPEVYKKAIESLVREGKVQCQEVFLFTENSTFEFTYYQG